MPIYLETRAFISTHLIGSRVYLLPSHRPPLRSHCLHYVGVFVRFLLAAFLLLLIFQQVTCTQNKIKAGQRQRQVTNEEGGAAEEGAGEGEREQAPPTTEQHQRNAKGHLNMEKLKQSVQEKAQAARAELLEMRSLFLTASGCRTWQAAAEAG